MSINLTDVRSGYNLAGINDNFQKIEAELNDNVLRRDGLAVGEPNQMQHPLDMNGNEILNATIDGVQLGTIVDEATAQADRAETEANRAETEADRSRDEANRAFNEAERAKGQANLATTEANRAATEADRAEAEADRAFDEANRSRDEADRAESISDELDDGIRNAKYFDPSFGSYPMPPRMEVPYVWFATNNGQVGTVAWAEGEQLHYVPDATDPENVLGAYYRVGGELGTPGAPQPITFLDDIILQDTKSIIWDLGGGDERNGLSHNINLFTAGDTSSSFNIEAITDASVFINNLRVLHEASGVEKTSSTGAANMPTGTQAQRPTPTTGHLRFNTDSGSFEGYDGVEWGDIGGGGTPTFQVVTSNVAAEKNSAYSVDLSNGDVTVTLPSAPLAGDFVAVGVYDGSNPFLEKSVIVASPDKNIMGLNENFEFGTPHAYLYFSFLDDTNGWTIVQAVGESEAPQAIRTKVANLFLEGTDTFNIDYDIGFVDVYVNGYRLPETEYDAVNGSTVVLREPLKTTSHVVLMAYNHVTIKDVPASMVVFDGTDVGLSSANTEDAVKEVWTGKPNKNWLINGDFEIDQRYKNVETIQNTNAKQYISDRWISYRDAKFQSTYDDLGPDSTPTNLLRIQGTGTSSDGTLELEQIVEDAWKLSGKEVTMSMWARTTAGTTDLKISRRHRDTDNTQLTQIDGLPVIIDDMWTEVKYTFTMPAMTKDQRIGFVISGVEFSNTDYLYVTNCKFEEGIVATSFIDEGYSNKLSSCQRFYNKMTGLWYSQYSISGIAAPQSYSLSVPLREQPTISFENVGSLFGITGLVGNSSGVSHISVQSSETPEGYRRASFTMSLDAEL